jgi:hypothetical protein
MNCGNSGGVGSPMVDGLVLGDEFVVAHGEGRSAEEKTEGKADEEVHGRKCVSREYPMHAFWWGIFY